MTPGGDGGDGAGIAGVADAALILFGSGNAGDAGADVAAGSSSAGVADAPTAFMSLTSSLSHSGVAGDAGAAVAAGSSLPFGIPPNIRRCYGYELQRASLMSSMVYG